MRRHRIACVLGVALLAGCGGGTAETLSSDPITVPGALGASTSSVGTGTSASSGGATTVATASAPTTTIAAGPREINEVFSYGGYLMTATKVDSHTTGDPQAAKVDVTIRATNNGIDHRDLRTFVLHLDGLDFQQPPDFAVQTAPSTTTEFDVEFTVPAAKLIKLDSASLSAGDIGRSPTLVPLGPKANVKALRHATVIVPQAVTGTFAGNLYNTGTVEISQVEIGASTKYSKGPEDGNLWFGVYYTVCVAQHDSFMSLILVLPDGSQVAGFGYSPPSRGEVPFASPCPDKAKGIVYFQVPPSVAGQTLHAIISDGVSSVHEAGSLDVVVPTPAPEDQIPT